MDSENTANHERGQGVKQTQYTDSGFAWVIVATSFLASVGMIANVTSLGVLFPELLEHFQVSQAKMGLIGSVKIVISDFLAGEYLPK